jgi:protein tyrosine/serine phosphatase
VLTNRRPWRVSAAALLLGLSLALPAAAQTARNDKLANIRIDNFGTINANYYRGAQPKGHDYADLAALGVKTVIDLTKDGDAAEPAIVSGLGMKFYRIAMTTHEPPSADQLKQFLKLVDDPASQPVYVHCQGGRHRTGLMTAVYRMTDDGWSADRAFSEMKQYKFGADFLHSEFKQFVYAYQPDRSRAVASATEAAATPTAATKTVATPTATKTSRQASNTATR